MSPKLALCSALVLGCAGLLGPALAAAQPRPKPLSSALGFEAELAGAAYLERGVPNVAVHVPAGFDPAAPLHIVVYVHGLRGCLPVLMGRGETRCSASSTPQLGWDLGAHHDAAGTNTVFVVPRLVYGKRGGQPGAFGKPGGFRAFLSELIEGPLSERLGRALALSDLAGVTLVAHSAGYEAAIAIMERGELGELIQAVVLFDALYAFEERYAKYALANAGRGFRLVSVSLRGGKPARHSRALEQRLVRALGRDAVAKAGPDELAAAVAAQAFVIGEGRTPHAKVPEHHMAEVLRALGLPKRTSR